MQVVMSGLSSHGCAHDHCSARLLHCAHADHTSGWHRSLAPRWRRLFTTLGRCAFPSRSLTSSCSADRAVVGHVASSRVALCIPTVWATRSESDTTKWQPPPLCVFVSVLAMIKPPTQRWPSALVLSASRTPIPLFGSTDFYSVCMRIGHPATTAFLPLMLISCCSHFFQSFLLILPAILTSFARIHDLHLS